MNLKPKSRLALLAEVENRTRRKPFSKGPIVQGARLSVDLERVSPLRLGQCSLSPSQPSSHRKHSSFPPDPTEVPTLDLEGNKVVRAVAAEGAQYANDRMQSLLTTIGQMSMS
jgi:hypothetical protein